MGENGLSVSGWAFSGSDFAKNINSLYNKIL